MNEDNSESQDTKPGWAVHPLVGQYKHIVKSNDWIAETPVGSHNYAISICAPGTAPTVAQIDSMVKLLAHLPDIIASSNLPDAPTDEWQKKHPNYQLLNAQISSLILYENGSFFMSLRAYPEDDWVPMFDISPDFKVTLAEWGV